MYDLCKHFYFQKVPVNKVLRLFGIEVDGAKSATGRNRMFPKKSLYWTAFICRPAISSPCDWYIQLKWGLPEIFKEACLITKSQLNSIPKQPIYDIKMVKPHSFETISSPVGHSSSVRASSCHPSPVHYGIWDAYIHNLTLKPAAARSGKHP